MKKMKILFLLGVCGLFLGACSSNTEESEVKQATVKSSELDSSSEITKEASAKKEDKENDEGIIARQLYTSDWKETWHDVEFAITDISVIKAEESAMQEFQMTGEGALGVKFVITNNGENSIDTYPDQALLVIGSTQIEADMLTSDRLGGEVLSGVVKEGLVTFALETLEDVNDIKDIRLKWTASDMNDYDDMSKDFDITLDLQ